MTIHAEKEAHLAVGNTPDEELTTRFGAILKSSTVKYVRMFIDSSELSEIGIEKICCIHGVGMDLTAKRIRRFSLQHVDRCTHFLKINI